MKTLQVITIIMVIIITAVVLRGVNDRRDYEAIARANEAAAQEAQARALREREMWEGAQALIPQVAVFVVAVLAAIVSAASVCATMWMHYQDWKLMRERGQVIEIDEDDLIIL